MSKRIFSIASQSFRHFAHTRRSSGKSLGQLRLFNLDLHTSVIADIRDLYAELGVEIESWSLSNHADIFDLERVPVGVVNQRTWRDLSATMVDRFLKRYGSYLEDFDGFICTYPTSFVSLFLPLGKPIIAVTATRYETPFTGDQERWDWLDRQLVSAVASGQLRVVANNQGDRDYFHQHVGIDPTYIPSICRYTKARYDPQLSVFATSGRSEYQLEEIRSGTDGRAMPKSEIFPGRSSWDAMAQVQGWIHIPYNVSQMTWFEQYYSGIPLFFPSDDLLLKWSNSSPKAALSELSFFDVEGIRNRGRLREDDLNHTENPEVIKRWIGNADFGSTGTLTDVFRFESVEHLHSLLNSVDLNVVSDKYESNNRTRLDGALASWENLLKEMFPAAPGQIKNRA